MLLVPVLVAVPAPPLARPGARASLRSSGNDCDVFSSDLALSRSAQKLCDLGRPRPVVGFTSMRSGEYWSPFWVASRFS